MPKWRITVLEGAKRDFARAIERSATDFGARQARTNLVTLDRAIAALRHCAMDLTYPEAWIRATCERVCEVCTSPGEVAVDDTCCFSE